MRVCECASMCVCKCVSVCVCVHVCVCVSVCLAENRLGCIAPSEELWLSFLLSNPDLSVFTGRKVPPMHKYLSDLHLLVCVCVCVFLTENPTLVCLQREKSASHKKIPLNFTPLLFVCCVCVCVSVCVCV